MFTSESCDQLVLLTHFLCLSESMILIFFYLMPLFLVCYTFFSGDQLNYRERTCGEKYFKNSCNLSGYSYAKSG